ncbi:hypothetical protein [Streptomyces sp. NRRL F-5123]|uniref:hypothetical protein n=1 Tax=Streptomyces sp. NRRL F-5123 TaxID=1463856 RepID=UPI0004E0AF96|nr:hypothetical protein [Streptomyces sp. NRRL F-5123]
MRAPHALAATCVAVSAALLLSACGGSKKDDGKIKDPGADVSTSAPAPTSSSAAPSPTAAGVKRPTITLPSDAKDVFEDEHTGDPVKDAVLADNAGYVLAMDEGVFKGTTTDNLGFYATEKGLANAISYVQGVHDKGLVWTGTVRFFNRKVTLEGTGDASVVYCSDESKAFPKHVSTGKVDKGATTARSYVLYSTHAKKSAEGVWQTTDIVSERGSKQCQP